MWNVTGKFKVFFENDIFPFINIDLSTSDLNLCSLTSLSEYKFCKTNTEFVIVSNKYYSEQFIL